MECNKDEAIRAKDIAVRKFTDKDYAGAKKFALKAQTLYPPLEGITQMVNTLDVYISANNKAGGETDLYGVLGVHPLADDETIKKQYRKLVLQLHPDKNKSEGADGAFLLVTEAFNVLSDKTKRSAYNTRRHIKIAQKVPTQSAVPGAASGSRQFQQKFPSQGGVPVPPQPTHGRTVDQKVPAGGTTRNPSSGASELKIPIPPGVNGQPKRGKYKKPQKGSLQGQSFFTKGDTFWTVCARCKMQYEYMRVYLDQMLKCPNCEQGFLAVEIPPPSNIAPLRADKQARNSSSKPGPRVSGANNAFGGASARWSPFSGTTAYRSNSNSATQGQPTTKTQSTKENLKRERDEAHGNSNFVLGGDGPSKKMRETNGNLVNEGNKWSGNTDSLGNAYDSSKWFPEAGSADAFQGHNMKVNNVIRELSSTEVRKMISEKAIADIQKSIRNWKLACAERASASEKRKVREKERQKSRLAKSMQNPGSQNNHSGAQIGPHLNKIPEAAADIKVVPEFNVPDPDFYVFDHDRLQHCFNENEVWAAYDNDDGMPRFYALIQEVTRSDPFKLKLSWLNSRNTMEFGSLNWVGRGFTKTCGDFWVGRHETYDMLNSFSHRVKSVKGPRGVIQIYPREGEIWALYRNWSPDWDKDVSDKIRHSYEMVEVLEDYKEEHGVDVSPMTKAEGFRTIYNKQCGPKVVRHIPKEEMLRFSHRVPHYILTGDEKPNAPKGSVELDPAATPPELLMTATNNEQSGKQE
ncbi:hypothetical protein vseg_001318 [Gypsophila vaccaria]